MSQTRPEGHLLSADGVEVSVANDVLMIVFANTQEEDEPAYLALQRYVGDDPEGAAEQAVYIELNDQSGSCYGGVVAARLEPGRLRLGLDEAAADHIGLAEIHGGRLDVRFALEEGALGELRGALGQLFEGQAVELEGITR